MEKEVFLSGYCRQIDQSRMVAVIVEDGELTEVDCCYSSCIYRPNCPIGKEIDKIRKDEQMACHPTR